jgi:hypothetical protein
MKAMGNVCSHKDQGTRLDRLIYFPYAHDTTTRRDQIELVFCMRLLAIYRSCR